MTTEEIQNLTLTADYHTHTLWSHGSGSIEENVKAAVAKGLKSIAITDHSFRHWMIAISPEDAPKMRAEVERLKAIYPIEILLGLEANLVSMRGDLDLSEEQAKQFDILIFGSHFTAFPFTFKDWLGWWVPNVFFPTKKIRQKNTEAYIKAIERYKPKIVVHINHMVKVNCKLVAEAAAKQGTLIELNGRRPRFNKQEIGDILSTGAQFVINSDAHAPENVGEFKYAKRFLKKIPIPANRIVNIRGK
ncbi:MAG: PHP domain-containing protein [Firmicutes bacterium]|nr:PHP domain-containing protein [Bacillota bacterium]